MFGLATDCFGRRISVSIVSFAMGCPENRDGLRPEKLDGLAWGAWSQCKRQPSELLAHGICHARHLPTLDIRNAIQLFRDAVPSLKQFRQRVTTLTHYPQRVTL